MKKFLITIAPLFIVLFFLLWFSLGLIGVLAFISAIIFLIVLAKGMAMWMEFVDKHIKD